MRRLIGFALLCLAAANVAAQERRVTVGVYPNPPKIFFNAAGKADGIQVDLLREVAQAEHWKLDFVPCQWDACMRAIQEGKIDILPDVAWTEERSKVIDFHQRPALYSWSQVYRHPKTPILSITDLDGKRLAVLGGSVQQSYFTELANNYYIRTRLLPVATNEQGFELVRQRRADAVVSDRHVGNMLAAQHGLTETPIAFQPVRLFFAAGKGRQGDVLAAFDRHLQAWQDNSDSVYFKILQRWQQKAALSHLPDYLLWTGSAVVGLLVIVLLLAAWLRRQVDQKTSALRDSEARLSTILESVDSLIYIKDADYRYQYVNRAARAFIQKSDAEIIGKTDYDLFSAETAADIRARDQVVIEQGERIVAEEAQRDIRADCPTYLSTKIPLRRQDGSIYGLCGISTDISARKSAEESTRVAATVFQSQEGMFVTGPDRRILDVNEAFTAMTGYTAGELLGHDPLAISLAPGGPDFREEMWKSVDQHGKWQGEVWTHRKTGEAYPAWLTVTAVRDADGNISNYVGTQADITQQKLAQDEILQLAYYDPLTGLPNRRLLLERLHHCLSVSHRSGQPVALLFLDLDNFKDLNDTRGHEVGDELLKQVAQRILGCVPEGDTVARLGGDEFVILLESIGAGEGEAAEHAADVGWKIIEAVGATYEISGCSHHATCSVGAALRVDHDTDIDDLMKRGDLAMYEAKRDGRNTLRIFHRDMESDVTYRTALETEMRESLGKSQ